MLNTNRITLTPDIWENKACIRNMRITVSLVLNLIAKGMNKENIIEQYPALEEDNIDQCLPYAAYLAEEELYTTYCSRLAPAG